MATNPTDRNVRIIRYRTERDLPTEIDAISYARFSTDKQSPSSTEDQTNRIIQCLEDNEIQSRLFPNSRINLIGHFQDEAESGFGTVGRDGFNQALSYLRAKKARLILIDDFKRFIRDMGTSINIYDFLQDYKAELIAASDNFSSADPGARLQFMTKAYASEEFLEGVSQDTRRGLNRRRRDGFSDGHLWFGIGSKSTRKTERNGKLRDTHFEYFVIEHLAAIVVRIFRLYVDGFSTKNIARILNQEGVLPPNCYDKMGSLKSFEGNPIWRDKTVWGIVNNIAYTGIIERGKTRSQKRNDGTKRIVKVPRDKWIVVDMPWLRIVPQDLVDQAKERTIEYHKKKEALSVASGKPFKFDGTTNHVLTGICKCADCGGSIVIVSGKDGGRYGCTNAYKYKRCPNNKSIVAYKLETPILEWLVSQISNDEIATILANKYNEFRKLHISGDLKELEQKEVQRLELKNASSNLVKAIEEGSPPQSLMERLSQLEKEKSVLEARIKYLRGLDDSKLFVLPANIKEKMQQVPSLIMNSEPFEVNRALKPILKKKGGIRLEKRPDDNGKEIYWAIGSANLGRLLGFAGSNPELGNQTFSLEIPFEIKLA